MGHVALNSAELQLAKMKAAEQNQHIQVFVRVRPVNSQERAKNPYVILDCPGTREVVVKERSVSLSKTFTFDSVFGPNSKQIEVYKAVVFPLLEEVLLGYNCTVFAYGQTGTGKTFTMEGERSADLDLPWESDPMAGIIPRALSQLFDELRLQEAEFTVRVSLLELYNEELFDLLSPGVLTDEGKQKPSLRLFEDSNRKGSVIIQGLEEVTVHNKHEVYRILKQGTERRRTASTQMNASSSRSHTIFTVTVHIKEVNVEGEELVKIGKLNLVDLAGSENIGRSGAVNKHAREAGSINQSLLTLGRVITALVEHTPHVPYRESKLTRLLQDSLGGRTKTSIIATVSPAAINLEETLSTLDYAHRAKDITNRPEVNQKMTKRAVLKEYTEEIERLRKDLNACREKNGVFLDKENYAQLLAESDSQKQEINEKVVLIRTLEESIQRKDEDYVKLEGDLEESRDNLAACNAILDGTKTELDNTRQELEFVRLERDQKSHLVKNHVKTEKKLTAEAGQLLSTADDATSNLEKMYRKLERKTKVEQQNLDAGSQFQSAVTDALAEVSVQIEAFRVEHSGFCGNQRLALESLLTEKEQKLMELKKSIRTFVDSMSKLEIKDHVNSVVLTSRKWNKENVQEAENLTQVRQNNSGRSLSEIIKQSNRLGSLVNDMSSTFQKTLREWDETVKEQMKAERDFVNTNLDLIREFHVWYMAAYKNQSLREETLRATILAQEQLQEKQSQEFTASLNALLKNYEMSQKELRSNSLKVMANVQESMKASKNMADSVATNREALAMKSAALLTSSENKAKMVDQTVSSTEKKLRSVHVEAGDTIKALDTEVNEHFENDAATLCSFDQRTKLRFNDQEKELNVLSSKFDTLHEKLQNDTVREMTAITEKLNSAEKMEADVITDAVAGLGDHCSTVSDWAEKLREETDEQATAVTDFWETIYLQDRPTGATPQRKSYVYPRLLSATSPHERITSRFLDRLKKKESNDLNHNDPNETF